MNSGCLLTGCGPCAMGTYGTVVSAGAEPTCVQAWLLSDTTTAKVGRGCAGRYDLRNAQMSEIAGLQIIFSQFPSNN
jgi:hypothetical protein